MLFEALGVPVPDAEPEKAQVYEDDEKRLTSRKAAFRSRGQPLKGTLNSEIFRRAYLANRH